MYIRDALLLFETKILNRKLKEFILKYNLRKNHSTNEIIPFVLCSVIALLFYNLAWPNVFLNFSFFLGLFTLPFATNFEKGSSSYVSALLFFLPLILLFFSASSTLFYLVYAFGLNALLFLWKKRLNFLPIFLLLLISPVASIVADILGFPIRLFLSEAVANVLSFIGFEITAEGNILKLNGDYFSVDQACVGLNMLITGLLFTIINMAYLEKKNMAYYSFFSIPLWLVISFLLMILANFCRIMVLVILNIPPTEVMHDVVGLVCLLVYNLAPMYLLLKFRNWGLNCTLDEDEEPNLKRSIIFFGILFAFLLTANELQEFNKTKEIQDPLSFKIENYDQTLLPDGIVKLTNSNCLVYIKPPVSPLRSSHDPKYCWKGSGYEMRAIQKKSEDGHEYYWSKLIKDQDEIYSAWWWTDGNEVITEDLKWRINSIISKNAYFLINVNTDDPKKLLGQIKELKESLKRAGFKG